VIRRIKFKKRLAEMSENNMPVYPIVKYRDKPRFRKKRSNLGNYLLTTRRVKHNIFCALNGMIATKRYSRHHRVGDEPFYQFEE
jgi:hypothetical protein